MATCWYCLDARSHLLHASVNKSKFTWLQCGYCKMRSQWKEDVYLNYPCGWWELHPHICNCASLDKLGWMLKGGDCVLFVPKKPMLPDDTDFLRLRDIRIECIFARGHAMKIVGKFNAKDYSKNVQGMLLASELITVKPFRHMYSLAQYFLGYTRPKLKALRMNSLILKALPFSSIKCLSRVNTATKCSLFSSIDDTMAVIDARLINCLTKLNATSSKNDQTHWQWQQFTNPINQDKWFWRMADDVWFIVSGQHIGHGPTGIWQRYRDPISNHCFWWRSDNDWGWEDRLY